MRWQQGHPSQKSIKEFYGKPTVAWSIEATINYAGFDCMIASTDDHEVEDVAKRYATDVPFMCSAVLADDYSGTTKIIVGVNQWHIEYFEKPYNGFFVYATVPLIKGKNTSRDLKLLLGCSADYTFSVTSFCFPNQRGIRIINDLQATMFQADYFYTHSQGLEEPWHDACQFYREGASTWSERQINFISSSAPKVLQRHCLQDIDTLDDWVRAELMFSARSEVRF